MTHCCKWAQGHALLQHYHNTEWGVPVHDDKKHFEFLILDAFQAGLSWLTILKKREHFKSAFAMFDYEKVAAFGATERNTLVQNEGIIRNKLKIDATINNAERFLDIIREFGSFDAYIWQFTDNKTICNAFESASQIPAKTQRSDNMSKDLKKRGFKFVGSTICYSYMQAAGMVNDHETSCFRYPLV